MPWPKSVPGRAPALGSAWLGGADAVPDGGPAAGRASATPEHQGRPGARPGPLFPARAAWWVVPGAAAGIVLAGVGSGIGVALTGSAKSATSDLLGEAGLWVAMLATAVLVSSRYGSASLRRDYGLSVKAVDVLWGVLAVAAALAVAQGVLLTFANTRYAGSNDQLLTQQQGHAVGLVVVSVIVALGAPFFEELFFRGFLRTALQARFGAHGAVWLQAAVFGLAHLGEASSKFGNVSVVLAMFGVGAVLGYTAKLTGRLGAGMVAHCMFNLVAVASLL